MEQRQKIFFLGIGGIGMSALARYYFQQGMDVSGYDRTPTKLTDMLVAEGMKIIFEDDPAAFPENVDKVIYTPAIPASNNILNHVMDENIPIMKRAEALEEITHGKTVVAVAGTHGKTTITSIIAHILKTAEKNFAAFIGGIGKNYGSNFVTHGSQDIVVVEADEFDRSFLRLAPDIAVISSIDADHLDIYNTSEELLENFSQFVQNIKPGGKLIAWHELDIDLPPKLLRIDYAVDEPADIFAAQITAIEGHQQFAMLSCNYQVPELRVPFAGEHNVANAMAASSVCFNLGLNGDEVKKGLESYLGVERRFDIRINSPSIIYIDDYAHHPEEINTCINSVRKLYPQKRITGIFQPHLYSRTRDFAQAFAQSLDSLDKIILTEIYPAREEPIAGISSAIILDKIKNENKILIPAEKIVDTLKENDVEVVLTMGAGDIDRQIQPIESMLLEKLK